MKKLKTFEGWKKMLKGMDKRTKNLEELAKSKKKQTKDLEEFADIIKAISKSDLPKVKGDFNPDIYNMNY